MKKEYKELKKELIEIDEFLSNMRLKYDLSDETLSVKKYPERRNDEAIKSAAVYRKTAAGDDDVLVISGDDALNVAENNSRGFEVKKRLDFIDKVIHSDDIVKDIDNIKMLNEYLKNGWKLWGSPMVIQSSCDEGSYTSSVKQRIVIKDQ